MSDALSLEQTSSQNIQTVDFLFLSRIPSIFGEFEISPELSRVTLCGELIEMVRSW